MTSIGGESSEAIRPVDHSVLEILLERQVDADGMSIADLSKRLEVTATAVRQRLDRLAEAGLIEREKVGQGRGRPQFRYHLTKMGRRVGGASYVDLANALWQEILELPNPQQRGRILRRVAARMGKELLDGQPDFAQDATLDEKLQATAIALTNRKIMARVDDSGALPVLDVQACPYPELAEESSGRQLCEMEQEMLSEAIGQSIQLDCCRLDGHGSCQFRPVATEANETPFTTPVEQENTSDN